MPDREATLIVIPPAVSLQLARSFKSTFGIAILVSMIAVIGGLYVSFVLDLAPGGTIVLIAVAILIVVIMTKGALNLWK